MIRPGWVAATARLAWLRVRQSARGVWLTAAMAGVAWFVARQGLHHPRPIFAAGAAIVCLSPGVASRGGQAVGLLVGVAVGVTAGGCALLLSVPLITPVVVVIIAAAMSAASLFGVSAVMLIQAGISAILVLAGGSGSGWGRLSDTAVGGALGLLASQVLFSPDAVGLVTRASRVMLDGLAASFEVLASAVADGDAERVLQAVAAMRGSYGPAALGTAVTSARGVLRWTARGRLAPRALRDWILAYGGACTQLYAVALLLASEIERAMREGEPKPAGFETFLRSAAERCLALSAREAAGRALPAMPGAWDTDAARGWRRCGELARFLGECLDEVGARAAP